MGFFDFFKSNKVDKEEKSTEDAPRKESITDDLAAFLKRHEQTFKKFELPFVEITAHKASNEPLHDPLKLTSSKILGKPFFPIHKEYPQDKSGNPMYLLCQINFKEIPPLQDYPQEGILQLFFSKEGWYEHDVAVMYHDKEELTTDPITDFSFIDSECYEESPTDVIQFLSFIKKIDQGAIEDVHFEKVFKEIQQSEKMEISDTLHDELYDQFYGEGNKIGGYAAFTQYEPRSADSKSIQLLQLDSNEFTMFGDSGLAHLFIEPEDLKNKNFEKAWFYWDCC